MEHTEMEIVDVEIEAAGDKIVEIGADESEAAGDEVVEIGADESEAAGNEIVEIGADESEAAEDDDLTIEFKYAYRFEGKIYKRLDLSGLASMNATDMIKVSKAVGSSSPVLQEMSLEYALYFAARATDMPVEFFQQLRPKDAIRLKNKVTSFFYGED